MFTVISGQRPNVLHNVLRIRGFAIMRYINLLLTLILTYCSSRIAKIYLSLCIRVCVCVCVYVYHVSRWWIEERPPDMVASCDISGCPHPTNKQPRTTQPQSHQSVEVMSGWRCSLPPSFHMCSTTTLRHGESEPPFC